MSFTQVSMAIFSLLLMPCLGGLIWLNVQITTLQVKISTIEDAVKQEREHNDRQDGDIRSVLVSVGRIESMIEAIGKKMGL